MRVFIPRTDAMAVKRALVAAGMGVACGYQSWLLGRVGLGAPVPQYEQVWIAASYVFLGLAIGATARWASWYWRAPILALLFSVPILCGVHTPGTRWVLYAAPVVTAQMASALLIGFLGDAIFPLRRAIGGSRLRRQSSTLASEEGSASLRQRLVEAKTELDRLDRERESRGDMAFGRHTEDRIVWAELLDLELQDIDERFHRICQTAGQGAGRSSRASGERPDSSSP